VSTSIQQFVKYWAYFCAKILAVSVVLGSSLFALERYWPVTVTPHGKVHIRADSYLLFLVCAGVILLIGVGLYYLCILDQRYRCRVCLRRLRMPVTTGSWSKMLQLGRPQMEYICIYGHGTLNIPELHISGIENPEWTRHSDYWAELCGSGKGPDSRI